MTYGDAAGDDHMPAVWVLVEGRQCGFEQPHVRLNVHCETFILAIRIHEFATHPSFLREIQIFKWTELSPSSY